MLYAEKAFHNRFQGGEQVPRPRSIACLTGPVGHVSATKGVWVVAPKSSRGPAGESRQDGLAPLIGADFGPGRSLVAQLLVRVAVFVVRDRLVGVPVWRM